MVNTASATMTNGALSNLLDKNAASLVNEINWFVRVVNNRLTIHFGNESGTTNLQNNNAPSERLYDSNNGELKTELQTNQQFVAGADNFGNHPIFPATNRYTQSS